MSDFTPGPWEVRVIGNHKIRMVYPVREDGPRGFICDDVPSEANARLIAAAPDLAAACEQAHVALASIPQGELKVEYAGDTEYWQVGELLVYIEDALAKARGEEVDDA